VVTHGPGLCIYGKRVVDTFLQRIGWLGAWQLWHLSGGLHIQINHRFSYSAGSEQDEPRLYLKVWCLTGDTLHAGSPRDKAFGKMNRSKVIRSGYTRFRGVPGVVSYVNTECLLVEISLSIEYVCSVKSEAIKLDRRVDLRCAWSVFPSKEIFGCILRVILQYASHVVGYDTSTRYRSDSRYIPGWLDLYCAGSVSGKSRCWQRFCSAINCK